MTSKKIGWPVFLFLFLAAGCTSFSESDIAADSIDYRQEMRTLVSEIHDYSELSGVDFQIIPQNGQELLTLNGEPDGPLAGSYISAIDGLGREDLYFGYNRDNASTPEGVSRNMEAFLDRAAAEGLGILVTDYCRSPLKVEESYNANRSRGYLSFAADSRDLDRIPTLPIEPVRNSPRDILSLSDAENFLYLINPSENDGFPDKKTFLKVLKESNYDLLLIDLFFDGTLETVLSAEDIKALRQKPGGGRRLVIAYMSIGEAEDYRYYWDDNWEDNPPSWMAGENSRWKGNYKVRYWDPEWKTILFGKESSYLNRILEAGFDGIYLDIIDAFEYFENS